MKVSVNSIPVYQTEVLYHKEDKNKKRINKALGLVFLCGFSGLDRVKICRL
jgi:hypothetical protein